MPLLKDGLLDRSNADKLGKTARIQYRREVNIPMPECPATSHLTVRVACCAVRAMSVNISDSFAGQLDPKNG
jgi:hypothetical protein